MLQPAKSVGGDLYDAFMVDPRRLCFLVGDVTGKGAPAALFMALSKALSRSLLMRPDLTLDLAVGGGVKLSTGVFVLYADTESFTLMTPQGHMFAGWITFSAERDAGGTAVQAQVLMRANDPLYELGMTFGGHRKEDVFWAETLTALGRYLGADGAPVTTRTVCVDSKRQWHNAGNVWHNTMIRSVFQTVAAPFTALRHRARRTS